nr:unnamed protein product [Digitaria exilis]
MGIGGVVAGREAVAAAASWGRGLGKRVVAAARWVVGRAEVKEGAAGRAEGKDGVAGRPEGKDGVAGRAEGKDGVAGDGAVAAGVAAATPKVGKAEPGPRVEGPASRPKPDAAIGSARVAEHETLAAAALVAGVTERRGFEFEWEIEGRRSASRARVTDPWGLSGGEHLRGSAGIITRRYPH